MTERKELNEQWEARINALLDGELDAEETAELQREAESNAGLAQAIVEAYRLQAMMDQLEIERAPASLRAKLSRIPQTESAADRRWFGMPRWLPVGAVAAVPLLVIAVVMMQSGPRQRDYTEAEVLQARQDVLTAFAYLDRVGERAGRVIEGELAKEFSDGVNDNVSRYMPFTHQSEQEEKS